jgi:hypothetical protein
MAMGTPPSTPGRSPASASFACSRARSAQMLLKAASVGSSVAMRSSAARTSSVDEIFLARIASRAASKLSNGSGIIGSFFRL